MVVVVVVVGPEAPSWGGTAHDAAGSAAALATAAAARRVGLQQAAPSRRHTAGRYTAGGGAAPHLGGSIPTYTLLRQPAFTRGSCGCAGPACVRISSYAQCWSCMRQASKWARQAWAHAVVLALWRSR